MKVKVCDRNTSEEVLTLQEIFIKGRPDPVVDEAHLNFEINKDKPTGPFSNKLVGLWKATNYQYEFCKDGTLMRHVGKYKEKVGYWWYDFPVDCFETPDYAGVGEIWFLTGEKNKIEFSDQSCKKLEMNNDIGAISAVWKQENLVEFYPI